MFLIFIYYTTYIHIHYSVFSSIGLPLTDKQSGMCNDKGLTSLKITQISGCGTGFTSEITNDLV